MEEIQVHASSHTYPIFIGADIRFQLDQLLTKKYASILIISDDVVADLYLADIIETLSADHVYHSIISSGEQSKNVKAFYQLHTDAITYGLDRQSLIVALGGGVVGDLAGFVAATYMRGIDYVQIPTTILAHDSSVGGKVAINHESGKNLIGSFYPPKAVVYDIATLHSLTAKEIRSGYAELIKEALIADKDFFNKVIQTKLDTITNEQLQEHLRSGIDIKAAIVEIDEREAGVRMHLNLGHTLGHAIEAELGYGSLTHGEAVAIGLLFSLYLSEKIFSVKLPYGALFNWLKANNYPMDVSSFDEDALIHKMKSDKKTIDKKIQMVLLKDVGVPIVKEVAELDLKIYLKSFIRKMVNA
ncbi:3-dehydroquinate synthase [Virgibacillus halotolerans]|uniref:3-dehydroquinate synthase n=1 Tax=Virgibacillus halotolerans TaxID=1071053 RepID=UPI0019602294|nr:3-dehydroquinate synthase [Virgibacillus halotolerans]